MITLLSELLEQPVLQALGWSLVHFLWQGTLLVLVVRALLLMLPSASARARYALACAGLIGMAILPVTTGIAVYPRAGGAVGSAAVAGERAEVRIAPAPVRESASPHAAPNERGVASPAAGWVGRLEATVRPWLSWIVLVWIGGVALLSVRLLGGWIHLQRLRRLATSAVGEEWERALTRLSRRIGVRRSVRLLSSLRVEVPCVIGVLKPVILLPISVLNETASR
jgi:beta-lactamase regulating signal transducer with metallopeptidase domain